MAGQDVEVGRSKVAAGEMCFNLYDRALHPELFRIDRSRNFSQPLYQARIWIAGMSHIVTVDAGVQPDPRDLNVLVGAIRDNPESVVVGLRRPGPIPGSRIGPLMAAFCLRLQTGVSLEDIASGFRAYPVRVLQALRVWTRGAAFDSEVLVRAAWAGASLRSANLPVTRRQASPVRSLRERVVSVLLNIHLTLRSIVPWPHRRIIWNGHAKDERITARHPMRSLRRLISESTTPRAIALATAMGVILGTLPLFFVHTVTIIFCASFFRLNKPAAIMASQLCMPPIVPALCIEMGHLIRHGHFLTELSLRTLGYQAWDRLIEWIIGSLVMAPVLGLLTGLVAYALAVAIGRQLARARAESSTKPRLTQNNHI